MTSDDAAWQWYRSSSSNGPWTEIEGTTDDPSNTKDYTPGADDVGRYLRATATYKDGHSGSDGDDKTAHGISDNAVRADTSNKAPVFENDEGEEIPDDRGRRQGYRGELRHGHCGGRPRRGHGPQRRHADLHL